MGAVQECEKGRVPLMLSRTQSTKSLFDAAPAEGSDELRQQLADLKARVRMLLISAGLFLTVLSASRLPSSRFTVAF